MLIRHAVAGFEFIRRGAALLLIACLLSSANGAPALAQNFLEQIFGVGASKPVPMLASRPPRSTTNDAGGVFSAQSSRTSPGFDAEGAAGGTFRTVCVRMCDGFYVPISFATTRKNFYQDQVKCRATCGDDARLFTHRNPGGHIEEAIDLSGRVYGRLPNAFRYRKSLVEGCTCRPPPWSDAELARHRSYADTSLPAALAESAPVSDKLAEQTAKSAELAGQSAPPPVVAERRPGAVAAADAVVLQPVRTRVALKKTATLMQPSAKAPLPSPHAAPAPSGGGGLFGFGSPSMGLGGSPQYTWPGDAPPKRR